MGLHIAYMDESGDPGETDSSSNCFILTTLYMPSQSWQQNLDSILATRKKMMADYGFPKSLEMHTRQLILGKKPYSGFGWSFETIQKIVKSYGGVFRHLDIKIINVVIKKSPGLFQEPVLDRAVKYSVQRLENYAKWDNPSSSAMYYYIITDTGRAKQMRQIAHDMRKSNIIPIPTNISYDRQNHPIQHMLWGLGEESSENSHFVQLADFVACFLHYWFIIQSGGTLARRVQKTITPDLINTFFDYLLDCGKLNTKASKYHKYGFVIY